MARSRRESKVYDDKTDEELLLEQVGLEFAAGFSVVKRGSTLDLSELYSHCAGRVFE
jgi:hypothetical protein